MADVAEHAAWLGVPAMGVPRCCSRPVRGVVTAGVAIVRVAVLGLVLSRDAGRRGTGTRESLLALTGTYAGVEPDASSVPVITATVATDLAESADPYD